MDTTSPTITPELARHVLWVVGGRASGPPPRTYTWRLIELIVLALGEDEGDDIDRLTREYPAEVAAVRLAEYDPAGGATLRVIANSRPTGPLSCTCGDTSGPFTPGGLCETCAGGGR